MWVQTPPHTSPLSTYEKDAKATSRVKLGHLNETADIITSNLVDVGTGYSFTWNNNNLMKTVLQRLFQELHRIILFDPLNYYEVHALIIPFLTGGKEAGTGSLNPLFKDTEISMGELAKDPRISHSKPSWQPEDLEELHINRKLKRTRNSTHVGLFLISLLVMKV